MSPFDWVGVLIGLGLVLAILAAIGWVRRRRLRRQILDLTLDRWLDGEPPDEEARRRWREDP
jgi:hypothetical protein